MKQRNVLLRLGSAVVLPCLGVDDETGSLLQLKMKNTAGMKVVDQHNLADDMFVTGHQQLSDVELAEMASEQAWADSIENDPETKWLDEADDAYEQLMLGDTETLEMLEVFDGISKEKTQSVFFNQFDASLFSDVDGTMGLVKHNVATNTTMVMPSRAMFNMTIEEHIRVDKQNFRAAVGSISDHSTIYLQSGDFSLDMNKGSDTAHIDIYNKRHVKIIGATERRGAKSVPSTNIDIYGFDTGSRSMKKNFVFQVRGGGDVTIKNVRIRHAGDPVSANKHLHHSVATVTRISGKTMYLTMEDGFTPAHNFFGEHFMQLLNWRFDSNGFREEGMKQLGYKVGKWEYFNENDQVAVYHEGGRNFRCTFPSSLPDELHNAATNKMLIMHKKRTWVGVKADNVEGLVVSHVKFGAFGGAALNFKRVKNPVVYGVKCQPIHNHKDVWNQRTAWATCNDLGWIRNPWGNALRARKTTCMQQTDDCLNFHVFTPRVDQAASWFWNEWLRWNDALVLYHPNGEPHKEVRYTSKWDLPQDNYVLIKKYSPGGVSPLAGAPLKAGLQVLDYRVFNSRSRMMIKVNNALIRNVGIRHDFMSAINVEAEMCSKWNEGIPGHDILLEDVNIIDVNTAFKQHWTGALKIGSECGNHQIQSAHKNIKVNRYTFQQCFSGVPGCNSGVKDRDIHGVSNLIWRP